MITLNNASANTLTTVAHSPDWHGLIGLFALLPVSIFAGLFGARLHPGLTDSLLHTAWSIGVAIVLAFGLFVVVLVRRSQRAPSSRRSAAICLSLFSVVMLITMVAMVSMREMQEPTRGLYGYLIGARYVLPVTVAWLGLALAQLILLSARRLLFLAAVSSLIAFGAIVVHVSYQSQVLPKLTPLHGAHTSRCGKISCKSRAKRVPPTYPSQIFRCNHSPVFSSSISNFSSHSSTMSHSSRYTSASSRP